MTRVKGWHSKKSNKIVFQNLNSLKDNQIRHQKLLTLRKAHKRKKRQMLLKNVKMKLRVKLMQTLQLTKRRQQMRSKSLLCMHQAGSARQWLTTLKVPLFSSKTLMMKKKIKKEKNHQLRETTMQRQMKGTNAPKRAKNKKLEMLQLKMYQKSIKLKKSRMIRLKQKQMNRLKTRRLKQNLQLGKKRKKRMAKLSKKR